MLELCQDPGRRILLAEGLKFELEQIDPGRSAPTGLRSSCEVSAISCRWDSRLLLTVRAIVVKERLSSRSSGGPSSGS